MARPSNNDPVFRSSFTTDHAQIVTGLNLTLDKNGLSNHGYISRGHLLRNPLSLGQLTVNDQPLISVIIAVLNGAQNLQRCIDSVTNQTHPCKELIIIDGGSTDGTVDILMANDEKIAYWESKPDRGIYHALNKALNHAKGGWICFHGAEEQFASNRTLETIAPHLIANKNRFLVFGKAMLKGGRSDGVILGNPWRWAQFTRQMSIPHQAAFHNRRLFEEVKWFDEAYQIAADYELLLRLHERLDPLFVDQLITIMDGNGVSMTNPRKSLLEGRNAQIKNRVAPRLNLEFWHLYLQLSVAVGSWLKRS